MITRRDALTLCGAGLTGMLATSGAASPVSRFRAEHDQFLLDGRPFQIVAGEMHYPRVPRPLWRDRMRKLRALGLNTLSAYVFWNAHEARHGHFDFSGDLDVAAWIRTAQQEGLNVLLRPGPYVCAEWDGGGLPAWLFSKPGIRARSLDPAYFDAVRRWLRVLGKELAGLEIDRGGPILMTQIENEYGAFGSDRAYMAASAAALREAGFAGTLYTVDGPGDLARGGLPGAVMGVNFGTFEADAAERAFAARAKLRESGPLFCSEYWSGWFDHQGETHHTTSVSNVISNLEWMLKRKGSVSFYMAHGGTSFAFAPGANLDSTTGAYQPDITSYDYDTLLDEAGRPTAKFGAVRAVLQRFLPASAFGAMPPPERALTIAPFRLDETAALSDLVRRPIDAETPLTLEQLGQPHGAMLYQHRLARSGKGELRAQSVRDFALVRADGRFIGTIDRRRGERALPVELERGAMLEILVDTMGHVNYGPELGQDQKGLIGPVTLAGLPLVGWSHHPLPLDDLSALRFGNTPFASGPRFYRGSFDIAEPGFTFLDVRGWGKGYVWVNRHNLGRFWSAGPQRTLFVPAPWLRAGRNEVIVLDLFDGGSRTLAGGPSAIWDEATPA